MRLILASKSPSRKVILEKMGFEFDVEPSNVDESGINEEHPEKLVKALAELKASAVAERHDDAFVLGVDTVIYFEGKIIGKACSDEAAIALLKRLCGKEHSVFTGLCLINSKTGEKKTEHVESKIKLRDVEENELNPYVYGGHYKGKAGAYSISDPGFKPFVEKVDGCEFNILGMPFAKGIGILESAGIKPKK